ncbi:hypothetical protein [Microtetraspora niveoalba]|uniref:hypothetical protein n=1 Tax=Microtetraspora niveoalba TaxID=46175 RepID=UPI00082E54C9|nr:hypothetical protein [Microtetraspora niveoalba]
MIADARAAERFMRAAMLGVAMAVETQRILRLHAGDSPPDRDGTVGVEIPFPDSTVITAVLDAAAGCFQPPGDPAEDPRQAVLAPLLELATLAKSPGPPA